MKWEEWEPADAIRTERNTDNSTAEEWRRTLTALNQASVWFGVIILRNKREPSWMAKCCPSSLFSAAASDGAAAASTRWETERATRISVHESTANCLQRETTVHVQTRCVFYVWKLTNNLKSRLSCLMWSVSQTNMLTQWQYLLHDFIAFWNY